ncbi:MAG: GntR family transcriptional regulator, partial [Kocuria sp.]|nr:GntR family transcriptional regulator [Kocuria sp.]
MEKKTYTIVLQNIEDRLRNGELAVGDRLPAERALAEEFGISRASVREAIRVLDAMGLVRSGVGSGPSAGAVVVSAPSAALGWGLRMHLASNFLPVGDVVATREQLESQAAADAAARWSTTQDKISLTR